MASRKTSLRAVGQDEKPQAVEPAAPMTVTQSASSGSTRDLLVSMRDRVARDVENPNTPARDLAALTKRLMEIVRDIEAIDARSRQEAKDDAAEVQDGDFDASAV